MPADEAPHESCTRPHRATQHVVQQRKKAQPPNKSPRNTGLPKSRTKVPIPTHITPHDDTLIRLALLPPHCTPNLQTNAYTTCNDALPTNYPALLLSTVHSALSALHKKENTETKTLHPHLRATSTTVVGKAQCCDPGTGPTKCKSPSLSWCCAQWHDSDLHVHLGTCESGGN